MIVQDILYKNQSVQRLYVKGRILFDRAQEKTLYSMVTDGSAYFLINDFKPTSNTKIECFYTQVDRTANQALFGARESATKNSYVYVSYLPIFGYARSDYVGDTFTSSTQRPLSNISVGTYYLVKDKNVTTVTGDSYQYTASGYVDFETNCPLEIFACNTSSLTELKSKNSTTIHAVIKIYDNDILKHELYPIPLGDTQYSDTPAPQNAIWDEITQKYYIAIGGTITYEEITSDFKSQLENYKHDV